MKYVYLLQGYRMTDNYMDSWTVKSFSTEKKAYKYIDKIRAWIDSVKYLSIIDREGIQCPHDENLYAIYATDPSLDYQIDSVELL